MADIPFEFLSATNYAENVSTIFNRKSTSYVGWRSTEYGVPPIHLLFRFLSPALITQMSLQPTPNCGAPVLEILVSPDNVIFSSIAKIHDFYEPVSLSIMERCRYVKVAILEKAHYSSVGIDSIRFSGHSLPENEESVKQSQLHESIEELLVREGVERHHKWEVDDETLVTLHQLSAKHLAVVISGQAGEIAAILKDIKTVMKLGERILQQKRQLEYLWAKNQTEGIKEAEDTIRMLKRERDLYDEKYETSRFEDSIALDSKFNQHDTLLKELLQKDAIELENQKRRRGQDMQNQQLKLDQQISNSDQHAWWNEANALDQIEQEPQLTPQQEPKPKKPQPEQSFPNEYVFNEGDADMEKHLGPLLKEMRGQIGDPEVLRRYDQLEFLDVLGARIWMSAHSQNWRQRAAAVQAVLDFSEAPLPERYASGQTRNLFLALMQFARMNAEDPVLQIYYTSLKIVNAALKRPICGEDVPPTLVNKAIQKFMSILVNKVSEMNARAKQISLKTILNLFHHPSADIGIAVSECLRICRPDLAAKFIPVDKQNPRILLSRIQILHQILLEFKMEKRKNQLQDILSLLVEGSLNHSHNDVRLSAMQLLQCIHKQFPQGTQTWYHSLQGLRPTLASEIEDKLSIH